MQRPETRESHITNVAMRAVGGNPAYTAYAQAYDALLAEQRLTARPAVLDVPLGEGRTIPTFVLESGAGTPLVFLHGTPATSLVWLPLLSHLRGVRAVVVDRPGHGLSAEFDYADVPDLRTHAVSFVEGTLDSLGLERAIVVGSSLGGLWSMWAAIDRPERVSGVVALAPPGMLSGRVPFVFGALSVRWIARAMGRLAPPSPTSTRRLFKQMGDPPAMLSEAFVDAFTRGQRLPNIHGGTNHLIQRFVQFPGRFASRRLWLSSDDLAQLRQPALVLWGARDFLGDLTFARRVVNAMPDAELVEVGIGHLPWLQDARGVASAIERFVQDCSRRARRPASPRRPRADDASHGWSAHPVPPRGAAPDRPGVDDQRRWHPAARHPGAR